MKLNKLVINKTQEVYRAGVYNSLKNRSFTKNDNCTVIDILKQQLAKFNLRDLIFVSGNFNNRLGNKQDFITVNIVARNEKWTSKS